MKSGMCQTWTNFKELTPLIKRVAGRAAPGFRYSGQRISRILSRANLVYTPQGVLPFSPGGDYLSGRHLSVTLGAAYLEFEGDEQPPLPEEFIPVWPCSRWGLPGRGHCCPRRWSLTPPFHPYSRRSGILSVARSGRLLRPGCYPTSCSLECGLSSPCSQGAITPLT